MNTAAIHEIRKLALIIMVLGAILFGVIIWTQHKGQIASCERGKANSAASAEGWREAQNARQAAFDLNHQKADQHAVAVYDRVAGLFEKRAKIDCNDAFPLLDV